MRAQQVTPDPDAAANSQEQQSPNDPPAESAPPGAERRPDEQATSVEPTPDVPALPSVETLEERIKKLEEGTELDEAARVQRDELVRILKETITQLRAAQEYAEKANEFEQLRKSATERLADNRAQLAQPPVDPKPEYPADASVSQLEQFMAAADAEAKSAQERVTELEAERKRRADRKSTAPQDIADARRRLDDVSQELAALPPVAEAGEVARARRQLLEARQRAIQNEITRTEKEIASYDARGELLTARQDLAARKKSEAEQRHKAWQEIVNEARRRETQRVAEEAKRKLREAANAHPVVKEVAVANDNLAQRRKDANLADRIQRASARAEEISKKRRTLAEQRGQLEERLSIAGVTEAMGLILRNRLNSLPNLAEHRQHVRRRHQELGEIGVKSFEAEEMRAELADIEAAVRERMAEVNGTLTDAERQEIETAIRDLLRARRDILESFANDYRTYLDDLEKLDTEERRLIAEVESNRDFLLENILWVPSTSPPTRDDIHRLIESAQWFSNPESWSLVLRSLGKGAQQQIGIVIPLVLLLVMLLIAQRRLRLRLREAGDSAARGSTATITPTLSALAITLLMALPWPLLLLSCSWLMSVPVDADPFVRAIAYGLRIAAFALIIGDTLRKICRHKGLGEAHFGWPTRIVRLVRRSMFWLLVVWVPAIFVSATCDFSADESHRATLGRAGFIVARLAVAAFLFRILRPATGIAADRLRRNPTGWFAKLRYVWFSLAVSVPIALSVLALVGYQYSALQLVIKLQSTVWLIVLAAVVYALFLRWMLTAKRRLLIEQYRKRREAAKKEAQSPRDSEREVVPAPEPQTIDLSAISDQTRNLMRGLLGVGMAVGLWMIWIDVLPALTILRSVELWSIGERTVAASDATGILDMGSDLAADESTTVPVFVTLADLLVAFLVVAATLIATRNIPGLLEIALLQKLPLVPSTRYAITTISRYSITLVGLFFAFGAIGISWDKVQWLAAAVTVGLGFGLQEIFANFVSGLIILFERPVRVGDVISVGGVDGTVSRIRMRATTIVDWNRKELIVPNKEFVTGQIVNWSLTDNVLRVLIPVGIAYGSDTRKARELLLKVASENPRVVADPEPTAFFLGFGDSSLNFELRAFVSSVEDFITTRNDLHFAIDDAFRAHGIEIAFPQRDVHVRTITSAYEKLTQHQPQPTDGSPAPVPPQG